MPGSVNGRVSAGDSRNDVAPRLGCGDSLQVSPGVGTIETGNKGSKASAYKLAELSSRQSVDNAKASVSS